MKLRKILAAILSLTLAFASIPAFAEENAATTPKYVFMFIGDGMGSPQVTATQYYLGTIENPDAAIPTPAALSFTGFENVGIMTTYDATSFCPDSASTATSMASGNKTLSGVINYNIDKTESFKLITEYAKESGKKVGVITTVSLDHATPAAYYAKVESRSQYYDIAVQGLTGSTLDFLGGGSFLEPDGDGAQENLFALAEENGFTIADTNEAIRSLTADSGKVLAISPDLADSSAMQWEIDRVRNAQDGTDSLALSEMVQAAIQNLDGEEGFFLMTEGGKIDWSCHANDAMTSIWETIAFSDAVQVAVDFYNAHPDETLIIVTGDHETGGLTIGFAATAYDTHFNYLSNQTISYEAFDKVIATLRESGATFEDALAEIQAYYGLTTQPDQDLTLSEEELAKLQAAFDLSMIPADQREIGEEEELLYGGYEPLSMAVCHILNNKAGIDYTSYAHTGLLLPVYAKGVGAEIFQGSYDNTDIFRKTMSVMGLAA
ncbi:MAG TPA: alkaline phosphatase [Candidatus Pullichristensenella excrementigallinarum]|uniref:Alkaline phosphatase n=1 Tax=Candidatus Pullichristensenella excrementigallinarum TaxID=2840907 RepID=A0A9D1LCS1_9FIRM|nr:alkaline phosphatase [Candidatus Pullichristensenella excrementigallinarum]